MRNATGKGNDVRKVLTYYRASHGISSPYRVLCDSSILHLAPTRGIHLKVALPKLLGANCIPVVTRCVLEELRQKARSNDPDINAAEYQAAALYAKRCVREPCAHNNAKKSSCECISALLERGNTTKIILATNDKAILSAPAADFPVITISNQTRLILRKPSVETIENQEKVQAVQMASSLTRRDVKFLEEIDEDEAAKRRRNSTAFKPSVGIRKRRKAKGPNPLSVKKKKNSKGDTKAPQGPAIAAKDGGGGRKRRKRNKVKVD